MKKLCYLGSPMFMDKKTKSFYNLLIPRWTEPLTVRDCLGIGSILWGKACQSERKID